MSFPTSFRDQVEARLRAFGIDAALLAAMGRHAPAVRRGAGPALKDHYDGIARQPAYKAFAETHRAALEEIGTRRSLLPLPKRMRNG